MGLIEGREGDGLANSAGVFPRDTERERGVSVMVESAYATKSTPSSETDFRANGSLKGIRLGRGSLKERTDALRDHDPS